MDKDYRDKLEDEINRAEDKLGTLDPTSDEYRKVCGSLETLYKLKETENNHEAEIKLKERQAENDEVLSEREYEANQRKAHEDRVRFWMGTGISLAALAFQVGGMVLYSVYDIHGALPSEWMKGLLRNNSLTKTPKTN